MARKGSALAGVVAVAMLAACSGSDDAAPAATPAAPTTVVVTVAATTTEAPTTEAPTTEAPTAEAPTATIDPAQTLAAQVEADFREADRLGRAASMDPFDAEKEAAALDRRSGVIKENLAAKLADWRDTNYVLRENPDVPASITVEIPATLVLEGGDVAELQICEVNPWLVVELGAGPDGSEAVVDAEVSASRSTVFMRLVDGTWIFEAANQKAMWEGAIECSPE